MLHPDTEGILDAAADFLWSDEVRMTCSLSQSASATVTVDTLVAARSLLAAWH